MATPATKKATPAPKDDVEFFFDVEQGSEPWHELRRGVMTASRFGTIKANPKDPEHGGVRRKLLRVLAGEILSGKTAEGYESAAMARGREMEPRARAFYAKRTFEKMTPVGFVKRTVKPPLGETYVVGASPDSLVGERRSLEIKTMQPDLLIDVLLKGAAGLPPQHMAQCQGTMWVCGLDACDLILFYDGMPAAEFKIQRNETYIKELAEACETFNWELQQLVKKIREMGR